MAERTSAELDTSKPVQATSKPHPSLPIFVKALSLKTSCFILPYKYDKFIGQLRPCGRMQYTLWLLVFGIPALVQISYNFVSIWLFYTRNAGNIPSDKLYAGVSLRLLATMLTLMTSLFVVQLVAKRSEIAEFVNQLMMHRNTLLDEGIPLKPDFKIVKKFYAIGIFRNSLDFLGTIRKPNRYQYIYSVLPEAYKTKGFHVAFVVINASHVIIRLGVVFTLISVLIVFIETMLQDLKFRTSKGKKYKPVQWRRCQLLMLRQDQIFASFMWPMFIGTLVCMAVLAIYSMVIFFNRVEFPVYAQYITIFVALSMLYKHVLVPGIFLVSTSAKLRREALLGLVSGAKPHGSLKYFQCFMRSVNVSGIKIGSYFVLDRYACLGCVAIVLYYSINMFINFGR